MTGVLRRSRKALRLSGRATWRRWLLRGVAATIEHDALPLRRDAATVLDIGANRGQFAVYALVRFASARIHCFEPLPSARETLARLAAEEPRVRVWPVALGSAPARASLHVTARDDSSSLLAPTELQTSTFPATHEAGRVEVEVRRLDDVVASIEAASPILLKLDVQGFELEVLRGATTTLQRVDEVLVEVSREELYAGQALAADLHAFLVEHGFEQAAERVTARRSGQWLQADRLYRRARSPARPA